MPEHKRLGYSPGKGLVEQGPVHSGNHRRFVHIRRVPDWRHTPCHPSDFLLARVYPLDYWDCEQEYMSWSAFLPRRPHDPLKKGFTFSENLPFPPGTGGPLLHLQVLIACSYSEKAGAVTSPRSYTAEGPGRIQHPPPISADNPVLGTSAEPAQGFSGSFPRSGCPGNTLHTFRLYTVGCKHLHPCPEAPGDLNW